MNLEQGLCFIIKNHYRSVVVCFLILAIACVAVADFGVEHSIESWIDKGSDNYLQYRRMIEEFGDDATLLVVYNRADLTPAKLDDYQSIIENIRAREGVSIVYDPVDMFLLSPDGESLDEFVIGDLIKTFTQQPSDFRNVFMSKDAEMLGILILLNQDLEYLHPQIIADVRSDLINIGLHAHFAGTSYFSDILSQSLARDLTVIISGLSIIALVILLWFLRSPVVVACISTGIGISLIYALAMTTIMGIKLNLLTLILYPLIFCIGITTSIHLFSRRDRGVWSLQSAYKKIFNPTIITMVTTVIGCSVFIFAPQAVVREMGTVFPVAIIITYIVMLIFVPSAYQWLAGNRGLPSLPVATTANRVSRQNIIISIILFSLAIVAVSQLSRLRTEADAIYFFSPDSKLIQSYRFIEDRLTGLLVVDMIVGTNDKTPVTTQHNTENIAKFIRSARKLPELTTIISALDWLNSYTDNAIGSGSEHSYLSDDRASMRLTFRFRNISDSSYSDNIDELKRLWDEHAHPGLNMHITGLLPLILEAQDELLKTQAIVFPVVLVLMTLVLFLIIPSPMVLLSACLANFLPLLIMVGSMVVLDIQVNSINLFVVSVMLGVIVDDTIHLLYAWKNSTSIEAALNEVKPALWITTLTVVLAFSSLLFSSLRPIVQFGLLSIIAVIVAYLCDVFLLPLLLNKKQEPI